MSNYSAEDLKRYGLSADVASELAPMDYDPDAELVGPQLGPLPDGNHQVIVKLREPREGEANPTVSKGARGLFTKATLEVRHYRPDNEKPLGQYLNNYVPTSIQWDNQPTSDLVALCRALGSPAPQGLDQIGLAKHVTEIFRKASSEDGIVINVSTAWEMSYPSTDENGIQIFDSNNKAVYIRHKGEQNIKKMAAEDAAAEAAAQGLDPAATQAAISAAVDEAHVYIHPLTGEPKSVRASIRRVLGPVVS